MTSPRASRRPFLLSTSAIARKCNFWNMLWAEQSCRLATQSHSDGLLSVSISFPLTIPARASILFSMNQLSTSERAKVVSVLVEGNSLRGTSRITDVARMTIEKLLRDLGTACALHHDQAV